MAFNDDEALLAAVRAERFAEAEQMARARVLANDRDQLAWALLGVSLRALGRAEEVIPCFEHALKNGGGEDWIWSSYGTVLREAGRLEDARVAYLRAVEMAPDDPEILVNLGYLFVELGFVVKAKDLLIRALGKAPDLHEVRIHATRMCLECGEDVDAARLLQDWPQWFGEVNGELRVELASELIRLGQNQAGFAMLRSVGDDPSFGALAKVRMAAARERLNDIDEARGLLATLPPSSEGNDDVSRERAMLEATLHARDGALPAARALLEGALKLPGPRLSRIAILFQLAQVCDKLNDTCACLDYLAQAHAEQMEVARQLVPELLKPESVPLGIVDTRVTPEQYRTWPRLKAPEVHESPIFVLGFPRSGTTMLEQMLDAHPDLRSMDEQAFAQRVIERMESFGLRYPRDLGLLSVDQCDELRRTYWACVTKVLQLKPGQRLVDKNPLTMLRLPLLKRLFPEARIIFVVRHPCDVLLSCYMQHFNEPAFTVLCSSIERLARGYARAMQFWLNQVEVLQPEVHEWRYEVVLENFEEQTRLLGKYLRLEDASPLANFSTHAREKGYISTPSYAQVVKPLYKSSKGRWERYRAFFEPVLPTLQPILQHWNYDA